MKFVVCIDGRASSFDALDHAATIASGLGGSVTLVHSLRPEVRSDNGDLIQDGPEEAAQAGQSLLDRATERLEGHGLTGDSVLLDAENPVNGVLDFATNEDVDAIFIGHRALAERHETLFGSFAKDLISNSPIPVTVVSAATYENGN